MRCCSYRRLLLGLGLLISALAFGARPAVSQGSAPGEGLVLALYHASYDFNSWVPQLCDQPAHLYDSSSRDTLDRHIGQAQRAGIDAFVQAWYGPALVQNPSEMNFRTLLDRARAASFEVAALVDMSGARLNTADEVEGALVALRSHAAHGAYLKVNGRPVVFFLGQSRRLSMTQWETLRVKVDPNSEMIWIAEGESTMLLSVFDGLYLYDVAKSTQIGSLLLDTSSRLRMWNLGQAVPAYWVATVIPGYDDSAVVTNVNDRLVRLRSSSFYRENWNGAMASDPAWILLRSFNEWRYCTHVEPSTTYASEYLDLTAELIELYRESLLPPTPAPTVDAPAPSPTHTEAPEPTVEATVEITVTATLEPPETETPTPTVTLTPSVTPFRLPTLTPSPAPGDTPAPGTAVPVTGDRPAAGVSPAAGTTAPAGVGVGDGAVTTPVPRLPVEGAARRRCTLLPLFLPLAALVASRRSRAR